MSRFSNDKELSKAISVLVTRGWEFKSGGKHNKIVHTTHKIKITFSNSPSCAYAARNFRKEVERRLSEVGERSPFEAKR